MCSPFSLIQEAFRLPPPPKKNHPFSTLPRSYLVLHWLPRRVEQSKAHLHQGLGGGEAPVLTRNNSIPLFSVKKPFFLDTFGCSLASLLNAEFRQPMSWGPWRDQSSWFRRRRAWKKVFRVASFPMHFLVKLCT